MASNFQVRARRSSTVDLKVYAHVVSVVGSEADAPTGPDSPNNSDPSQGRMDEEILCCRPEGLDSPNDSDPNQGRMNEEICCRPERPSGPANEGVSAPAASPRTSRVGKTTTHPIFGGSTPLVRAAVETMMRGVVDDSSHALMPAWYLRGLFKQAGVHTECHMDSRYEDERIIGATEDPPELWELSPTDARLGYAEDNAYITPQI
ncbi:hypothetical protein EDD22DRAFT_849676 [Suillus occidentalis]|nr:hypothetical protein EDD22DRAFT_849676 [Suillus occidentalis]